VPEKFYSAARDAKRLDDEARYTEEYRKKQLLFMEMGFELINLSCNTYIEGKVNRQRTINVWRDVFTPITALATGIYAIADKGETVDHDALTALALLTSAAISGFDIYEQRYLFGAKNVDNVRRLVLRAQLAHAQEAMGFDKDNITYWKAVRRLAENQMVCSPGAILDMVAKAIEKGEVEAVPATSKSDDEQPIDPDAVATPDSATEDSPKGLFVPIEIKVGE